MGWSVWERVEAGSDWVYVHADLDLLVVFGEIGERFLLEFRCLRRRSSAHLGRQRSQNRLDDGKLDFLLRCGLAVQFRLGSFRVGLFFGGRGRGPVSDSSLTRFGAEGSSTVSFRTRPGEKKKRRATHAPGIGTSTFSSSIETSPTLPLKDLTKTLTKNPPVS